MRKIHCADTSHATLVKTSKQFVGGIHNGFGFAKFCRNRNNTRYEKQATLWYQACSVLTLTAEKEHEYYENVRLPNQKEG